MARLTSQDHWYKSTVQDRIELGANFRRIRYNGTELSLMPNMDDQGQGQRDRTSQEITGLFFQQYKIWIGSFEQKQLNIADAAFQLGASWEFSEDDGVTWQGIFILKPAIRQSLWYECIFAKFIANANLVVTYDVGQGTYSTVDGNRVEDIASVQFTAVVNQQQRPSDLQLPGTPASSIYLEGYHINPQTAPIVNKQQRLNATLNGVSGEFAMLPVVQPPATGATSGTGDLVKGLFVMTAF